MNIHVSWPATTELSGDESAEEDWPNDGIKPNDEGTKPDVCPAKPPSCRTASVCATHADGSIGRTGSSLCGGRKYPRGLASQHLATTSFTWLLCQQTKLHQWPITKQLLTILDHITTMPRLDYGNTTLAGLPAFQLRHLQSVLNTAARLIPWSSQYEHVTPMLQDLHWLRSTEYIDFKLAVLVYRCLHGLGPQYLSDYMQHVAHSNRRCVRSSSSSQLVMRRTRLSTVSDRAFPVAGSRV